MFEGLIRAIAVNAKAKTGVNEEFLAWVFAGVIFAIFGIIFISAAAYVWLTHLYGGAVAGLCVGGTHVAIATAIVTRSVAVRSRNRRHAKAQIELAAKQPGWRVDPGYVAMGVEIVKIIGVRNFVPLAAACLMAVGLSARRAKPTADPL